jgi:hypothetical protein
MIIEVTPETDGLAKIEVDTDGMVTKHNFPCPICLHRPAVLMINKGTFSPCWHCQDEGWVTKNKKPFFLTEPSPTSFGDHVIRPRWKSALCDMFCFFTLGYYKPTRKEGEECLGDLVIVQDSEWEERVNFGRCGSCNKPFSEFNRDAGGGMCSECWSKSH